MMRAIRPLPGFRRRIAASVRRASVWPVALAILVVACTFPGAGTEPARPDPLDIVRIAPREPSGEEEDDDARPFDPRQSERNLAERFPGVAKIDLVRVVIASHRPAGRCWTQVSRLWETGVEVDYAVGGETRSASGIRQMKEQGWWPIYRSPEGHGFERRTGFESIALRLDTLLSCRCGSRDGPVESDAVPLELRFQWTKGKMPAVSVHANEAGKRKGLSPTVTYGHLLTYDFEARGSFPAGTPGVCGAHVILSILNDPPIV